MAVVCDGKGSHHAGGQASALAVRTVQSSYTEAVNALSIAGRLSSSVLKANQAIHDTSRRQVMSGIGIAIAAVVLDDGKLWVAHVGDSRVYAVRNGQIQRMTRDHTMVNLFIEAELLTPEDALSHPEANVLSRSLGTDRQVDVEVSGPHELSEGDRVILCTDGVHRVLSDADLGRISWRDPQSGVDEALELVAAREGEDNSTAIALAVTRAPPLAGEVPQDTEDAYDPTDEEPPPEPEELDLPVALVEDEGEQTLSNASMLAIPATPAPAPHRAGVEPAATVGTARTSATKPKPPAVPPQKIAIGFVAAGISVVLGALLVFVGVRVLMGGDKLPDQPVGVRIVETVGGEVPSAPLPVPSAIDTTPAVFAPSLPPEPRRAPHRQEKFLQPPPGGTAQHDAVAASRRGDCGRSLHILRDAMKISLDHGSVYHTVWSCFNDSDQRPLLEARASSPEAFQTLLRYFEGDLPESNLPHWFQPAQGGIEARIEGWETSGPSDQFAEAILDRLGPGVVADHLMRDLWLEASAAAGLAEVGLAAEDPAVQWWARRVYYSQKMWNGPIGDLIRQERPEAVPALEALLARGVRGLRVDATEASVPEPIHKAWSVALGVEPPPDAKPSNPRPPPKPKPKIYRPNDPTTEPPAHTPTVFRAPK